MPNPTCPPAERITELVEGRLAGDALARLNEHLASCDDCRDLVAWMLNSAPPKLRGTEATLPDVALSIGASLQPGALVDRYVIERVVGAGAMGEVYAARDPALDRIIALKLLRREVAIPDLESRLLREAKAMARINHPHVISVHDAGRYGEQLYIAMEFIAGGTLTDWLKSTTRPWREILEVYMKAGQGLAEAHAAGIIHRDFKPDNVLVGEDGKIVRVTDFGLARGAKPEDGVPLEEAETQYDSGQSGSLDSALTRTGVIVGTPVYMAPEQHAAEAADVRSDVYAFTVALYEALYGERPFGAATLTGLHAAKLANRIRPVPAGRYVPPRIRKVLLHGLQPDPAERPQTMTALLSELARARRSSRAPAALAVALGLLGVTGAIYGAGAHRAAAGRTPVASASAPLVAECSTNRQCVEKHSGEPWLCRASDHACVAIASEDCTPYFEPGDLEAEDTVWLGALFPRTGEMAVELESNVNAVLLARKEFAEGTRELVVPGAIPHARRVAVALCDDATEEKAMRSAHHLVDGVAVPAILGFRSGQEVMDLAGSLLVQRGVLAVASLTTNPLITQLPQPPELPRMVWRTTYGMAAVAEATAAFVTRSLAPRRAASRNGLGVVLVRTDSPGHVAFGQAFMKAVAFDPVGSARAPSEYHEVTVGEPNAALLTSALTVDRAAERVVAQRPSFIVVHVRNDINADFIEAIERRWPRNIGRPTYLLAADGFEGFVPFLGREAERRHRVFDVESTSASVANAQFVARYNGEFQGRVTRTANPGSSYDAFFFLAVAAQVLGREPLAGRSLAKQFTRLLPPGPAVEIGPMRVVDILASLARGERVNLEGIDTSFDFDVSTGEATYDFVLSCPGVDAAGRATGEDVESGIVFRGHGGFVEGEFHCP